MKKLYTILLIIFGLIPKSDVFGQSITFPNWIKGGWQNKAESNLNNFEYWEFSNDSIFINKGLIKNKRDLECLNKLYSGYKINTKTSENLYRISFSKSNEKIIYEFKLQKVDYENKPVLTYSLTINGIVKRKHSISCNQVFMK